MQFQCNINEKTSLMVVINENFIIVGDGCGCGGGVSRYDI